MHNSKFLNQLLKGAGLAMASLLIYFGSAAFAKCPAATVADMKGVKAGKYPQQFELSEFERNAGCKLSFRGNPDIAKLNAKILCNPNSVPPVKQRLPKEPLVNAANFKDLFAMFEEGQIKPFVVETYPLEQTGYAIELLAKREAIGKIAIKVRD